MTLKKRFTILSIGTFLVPLMFSVIFILVRDLTNETTPRVKRFNSVMEMMTSLQKSKNLGEIKSIIEKYSFEPNNIRAAVFDDNRQIVISTLPPELGGKYPSYNTASFFLAESGGLDIRPIINSAGMFLKILVEFRDDKQLTKKTSENIYSVSLMLVPLALFIFTGTMAFFTLRSIRNGISKIDTSLKRISSGDFETPVLVASDQEITDLGASIELMRKSLRENDLRKSRFIMGISHDLKTPLALIKGYAEILSDDEILDNETRIKYAHIIERRSEMLEELLVNLIDYAKVSTDEMQTSFKSQNIKQFLDDQISRIKEDTILLERNFIFDVNLPETINILFDEKLISRVFSNIISNAFKNTKKDDTISIYSFVFDDTILIKITDTGKGISSNDLPFVFDPFYRSSKSREDGGHGLGLSIVRAIIEAHKWKIQISSTENIETCVTIIIPIL